MAIQVHIKMPAPLAFAGGPDLLQFSLEQFYMYAFSRLTGIDAEQISCSVSLATSGSGGGANAGVAGLSRTLDVRAWLRVPSGQIGTQVMALLGKGVANVVATMQTFAKQELSRKSGGSAPSSERHGSGEWPGLIEEPTSAEAWILPEEGWWS